MVLMLMGSPALLLLQSSLDNHTTLYMIVCGCNECGWLQGARERRGWAARWDARSFAGGAAAPTGVSTRRGLQGKETNHRGCFCWPMTRVIRATFFQLQAGHKQTQQTLLPSPQYCGVHSCSAWQALASTGTCCWQPRSARNHEYGALPRHCPPSAAAQADNIVDQPFVHQSPACQRTSVQERDAQPVL